MQLSPRWQSCRSAKLVKSLSASRLNWRAETTKVKGYGQLSIIVPLQQRRLCSSLSISGITRVSAPHSLPNNRWSQLVLHWLWGHSLQRVTWYIGFSSFSSLSKYFMVTVKKWLSFPSRSLYHDKAMVGSQGKVRNHILSLTGCINSTPPL